MSYKPGDIRNLIIGKTEQTQKNKNNKLKNGHKDINTKTEDQFSKSNTNSKKCMFEIGLKAERQEKHNFTKKSTKESNVNQKCKSKSYSSTENEESSGYTESEVSDNSIDSEESNNNKDINNKRKITVTKNKSIQSESEDNSEDDDDVDSDDDEDEVDSDNGYDDNNSDNEDENDDSDIEDDKNTKSNKPKIKNIKSDSCVKSHFDDNDLSQDISNKGIENKKELKIVNNSSEEENQRTIYVGNWPLSKDKNTLSKYFSKYGKIESCRLRAIAVGDPRQSKKVAYITKNFQPKRTSCEGYVKFEKKESAFEAVKENGAVFDNHHLMVNVIGNREKPNNKAIFVGNLPFECENDEIWDAFNGCGKINSIHIARNTDGISRGFSFINFETIDSVELALKQNFTIKNRQLRVKRMGDQSRGHTTKEGKYNMKRKPLNVPKNDSKKMKFNDYSRKKVDKFNNRVDNFNKGMNQRKDFSNIVNKNGSKVFKKHNSYDKNNEYVRQNDKSKTQPDFKKYKKNQFQGVRVKKSQGMRKRKMWNKNDKQKKKIIETLNSKN